MIFTEKKITINNNECKIDSPVVLYRGDYNVEVRFTIVSSPYKYSNKQETNVIEQTEASYGQLVIKTPNNNAPIFSEITATKRGAITFTITAEMIDEISEVGDYTFQIRLLDENKESRATIPEIKNGIEIREPIATEDVSTTNEVDVAAVGYALTTAGTTEDAFDTQGNYNKTTWGTGDRITAAKLNKIEVAIDGVNKKAASGGTGGETGVDLSIYQTKTDNTLNTTNKTVSGAINEINEAMVIAEEQTGNITVGEVPVGGSNIEKHNKMWLTSAHRGLVDNILKENTLGAFYNAYLNGADMIELDARLTKDGVLISNHNATAEGKDPNTGEMVSYTVAETNADVLCSLILSEDNKWGVQKIPTLEQVLHLAYNTGMIVNVDLKNGYAGAEPVAKLVWKCGMRGKVIYALNGSGMQSINKIIELDPDAKFIDRPVNFTKEKLSGLEDYEKRCYAYTNDFSQSNIDSIRESGCMLATISLNKNNFEQAIIHHPEMCEYPHRSDFKSIEEDYFNNLKLY